MKRSVALLIIFMAPLFQTASAQTTDSAQEKIDGVTLDLRYDLCMSKSFNVFTESRPSPKEPDEWQDAFDYMADNCVVERDELTRFIVETSPKGSALKSVRFETVANEVQAQMTLRVFKKVR